MLYGRPLCSWRFEFVLITVFFRCFTSLLVLGFLHIKRQNLTDLTQKKCNTNSKVGLQGLSTFFDMLHKISHKKAHKRTHNKAQGAFCNEHMNHVARNEQQLLPVTSDLPHNTTQPKKQQQPILQHYRACFAAYLIHVLLV